MARSALEGSLADDVKVGTVIEDPASLEVLRPGLKVRAPEIGEIWDQEERYENVFSCSWKELSTCVRRSAMASGDR